MRVALACLASFLAGAVVFASPLLGRAGSHLGEVADGRSGPVALLCVAALVFALLDGRGGVRPSGGIEPATGSAAEGRELEFWLGRHVPFAGDGASDETVLERLAATLRHEIANPPVPGATAATSVAFEVYVRMQDPAVFDELRRVYDRGDGERFVAKWSRACPPAAAAAAGSARSARLRAVATYRRSRAGGGLPVPASSIAWLGRRDRALFEAVESARGSDRCMPRGLPLLLAASATVDVERLRGAALLPIAAVLAQALHAERRAASAIHANADDRVGPRDRGDAWVAA